MINKAELAELRNDTPGCKNKIHLNNAGAALMPLPVVNTIKAHLDLEAETGGYEAARQEVDRVRDVYQAASQLLNCQSQNIALTANATDSYSRALSSIPFEIGDIILTTNEDYTSNQIAFLSLKKRFGVEVVRIPSAQKGGVDLDQAWKLMKDLRPKLAAVTHMPTNSGLIQPIGKIGEYCRDQHVLYLVDACQTVGQLSLDVQQIGCDFLSATCRKFLRGPRGVGFLYVSDNILNKGYEPLFIDMHGARWQEKDVYIASETAQRFEDWEFPYALILGTGEAINYALKLGMDRIEESIRFLANYTRERLQSADKIRLLDKGENQGGIITLCVADQGSDQLKALLNEHNVNTSVSARDAGLIDFDEKGVNSALRVSPHYYNTTEEIDFFISIINKL